MRVADLRVVTGGAFVAGPNDREVPMHPRKLESGRVGYLVLYLLGAPIGVLLLLWVLLGDNVLAPG
jgi:hypothetical protein